MRVLLGRSSMTTSSNFNERLFYLIQRYFFMWSDEKIECMRYDPDYLIENTSARLQGLAIGFIVGSVIIERLGLLDLVFRQ
jgi:hypothetical protein